MSSVLKVDNIEKVKNSYKIVTKDGGYCLKVIKYEFSHFYFILSAMKHLQRNGFTNIPKFILNKEKKEYGNIEDELNNKLVKNKLIDDELTIPEKPFLCWKTGSLSNYYNSLLLNFCKEKGIPLDVPFKFLTENHKNLLLYGKSDYKVKFIFKHNGKTKQKLAVVF